MPDTEAMRQIEAITEVIRAEGAASPRTSVHGLAVAIYHRLNRTSRVDVAAKVIERWYGGQDSDIADGWSQQLATDVLAAVANMDSITNISHLEYCQLVDRIGWFLASVNARRGQIVEDDMADQAAEYAKQTRDLIIELEHHSW